MKFRFIKDHQAEFPVGKMCSVLKASKSGYYKWLHKTQGKRELRRTMLEKEIETEYWASKGRSGSPRITKELNMRGVTA